MAHECMIRQISVFSENKPGKLASIAKALQDAGVNILAFSIAEADGFGVVRAIVNKPDAAFGELTRLGYNVAFTDVIAVGMEDRPGGLYEIAEILGAGRVNIEYAYAYSGREGAVLVLRVDNPSDAVARIRAAGRHCLPASQFQ